MRNIFRKGRPKNFKLSRAYRWSTKTRIADKRHDLQGQSSRSQGHVMRLTCVWHTSREWYVLERPNLGERLPTRRTIIMRRSFKVKGQRYVECIMLRPEVRHILRKERSTSFKFGTQMEYEDPYRWPETWPPRSKVKIWQVLTDKSITERPRNTKVIKMVAHPT